MSFFSQSNKENHAPLDSPESITDPGSVPDVSTDIDMGRQRLILHDSDGEPLPLVEDISNFLPDDVPSDHYPTDPWDYIYGP